MDALTFTFIRVIIFCAVQKYMRLFQFKISQSYVTAIQRSDDLKECIDVTATPWFDLTSSSNREGFVDNIGAFVGWQNDMD